MYHWLQVTFISCFLTACIEPFSQSSADHRGFVFCGANQPETFNPQLSVGGGTVNALSNQLFDRLLTLNPQSHQPEPMLAKSWEISADGKIYRFQLRENVQFHRTEWFQPSRPMNAHDVVFSFSRIIDPAHSYHHVSNGYYPRFQNLDFARLVTKVQAIAPDLVEFTLSQPNVSFLPKLASTYAAIHSEEYATHLSEHGIPEQIDNKPIGSGPFLLDRYKNNQYIRLKRHWGYWNGAPMIDQIIFDTTQRGMGNLVKLITGECDILASPKSSQVAIVTNHPQLSLSSQTGMNLAFLMLNTNHPALAKTVVRQAIQLALDRDEIVERVYHGGGSATGSLLPPMSWAYDPKFKKTAYNPSLANTLMATAGYRHGFSVDLLVAPDATPYNPSPLKTAKIIQAQLATIGIKVNIMIEDDLNKGQLVNQREHVDIVLSGWVADNGDPDNFFRPYLSCRARQQGLNFSNWCHEAFDSAIHQAASIQNREHRKAIYLDAQTILNAHLPVIPIAHGNQYHANIRNLNGLDFSPFGDVSFSKVFRSH